MSNPLLRLVVTATTILTLGPLSSAPAHAELWTIPTPVLSADPREDLDEFEVRLMNEINAVRTAAGRPRIEHFDSCVDRLAEDWASRIASTGVLEHRDQNQVLRRCNQSWAGENMFRGTLLTPVRSVGVWMASPPHREILMKRRGRLAGVAVARDSRGRLVGVLNVSDPN